MSCCPQKVSEVDITAPACEKKAKVTYICINIIIGVQLLAPGMVIGFSGTEVQELRIEKNRSMSYVLPFNDFTFTDEYLFTSLVFISIPIGVFLATWMFLLCGMRISLLLNNLLSLVGWTVISASTNHLLLYLGRFITGIPLGMTPLLCYSYLQDVTHKTKHKYIFSWIYCSINTGILLMFLIGAFCVWDVSAAVALFAISMAFISSVYLPETPRWLVARKRPDCACKVLIRLRGGGGPQTLAELEEIVQKLDKPEPVLSCDEILNRLMKPQVRNTLCKMILLFVLLNFSGAYTHVFYATDIITPVHDASHDFVEPNLSIALCFCVTSILVNVGLHSYDRRRLVFASALGMTFSFFLMFALALFIVLLEKEDVPATIPLVISLVYSTSAGLGFLTIPWTMLSDVFPQDVQSYAANICLFFFCVFGFIVTIFKSELWTVTLYLVCNVISTVFVYKWLPSLYEHTDDMGDDDVHSNSTNQRNSDVRGTVP